MVPPPLVCETYMFRDIIVRNYIDGHSDTRFISKLAGHDILVRDDVTLTHSTSSAMAYGLVETSRRSQLHNRNKRVEGYVYRKQVLIT